MSKLKEAKELFQEIGEIYGLSADEVEEVFYSLIQDHLEEENIILDEDGLYVNGILYEYFDLREIRKFRHALDERVNKYAIEKWKNILNTYLKNILSIEGVLKKEGKKNYYFQPLIKDNEKINKILIIQVPKTNVKLDFSIEKGNTFKLYIAKDTKVFRKHNHPYYFNKFFLPAKIITRQSVKEIIDEKIISAFKNIYSIDDFKIKYISPIKKNYGIINLIIKKQISANLLDYLDNTFKKYGYIVNAKEK